MRITTQALIIIAAFGLIIGSSSPATAQDAVTASISVPSEAEVDGYFNVTIDITDITDFDAGQFDISFDGSVLRLDNITAGQIGATEVPVSLWNEISPGVYRTIVNVPGIPGVSGSGSLAVLHFHVIGTAGSTTDITLSNGFLNDNLAQEIPATWIGDSITVHENLYQSDINSDGYNNILDLILVGQHMNETGLNGWIPEDVNQDGTVNVLDTIIIGQHWTE